MKVLITGANGFLGQHLCKYLTLQGFQIVAASKGQCRIPSQFYLQYASVDLVDRNAVQVLVQSFQPDIIIHNAALSKPDECNSNHALCIQQNVEVTDNLLKAFNELVSPQKKFIFISTDFIFGENGPHAEEDTTGPLNFYGTSKLMAEQQVIKSAVAYAIIRPVFIYGPKWDGLRGSFLHWIKSSLENQQPIKVVSDQLRTPTYVEDICKGIEQVIVQNKKGVYHLAGDEILSPYQMAITTATVLGLDTRLIEKVTSDTFIEPVQRAKRSGLIIDKAIEELNYQPISFEEGIKRTFNLT